MSCSVKKSRKYDKMFIYKKINNFLEDLAFGLLKYCFFFAKNTALTAMQYKMSFTQPYYTRIFVHGNKRTRGYKEDGSYIKVA